MIMVGGDVLIHSVIYYFGLCTIPIISKNQFIQVNTLSEEGVVSVVEFEVPGRVDTMTSFRPTVCIFRRLGLTN